MTQVDFYILSDNSNRHIDDMICRLCEKAIDQNLSVLIYAQNPIQAKSLDDYLWTYRADSFLVHQIIPLEQDTEISPPQKNFNYPIVITTNDSIPRDYHQLLINASDKQPNFHQQFERIAEMIGKDSQSKQLARDRYRFYRELGYSLNKHDL